MRGSFDAIDLDTYRIVGSSAAGAARLMQTLQAAVRDAGPRGPSESDEATRRSDLVGRAEAYMWSHVEDTIVPENVAAALGCSVRKLLYYFKRTYGLGPIGYFKVQRLNAVHDVLIADCSRRTIADIAADFGFWHMGHFGTAYRQMFGCTPSQTRARTFYKNDVLLAGSHVPARSFRKCAASAG